MQEMHGKWEIMTPPPEKKKEEEENETMSNDRTSDEDDGALWNERNIPLCIVRSRWTGAVHRVRAEYCAPVAAPPKGQRGAYFFVVLAFS